MEQSKLAGLDASLQKLSKWKTVFAGWQLGTRFGGDHEAAALRDHRELTMILRAEVNALVSTLSNRFPDFREEFSASLQEEAELLSQVYEERFPGIRATETGLVFDKRAVATMKDWKA